MTPGSSAKVVIVGAGIVGAASARALAREGFSVVVLDNKPVGSGATAAGMGHVVAMDDSEAQFALCRYSQTLWDDLAEHLAQNRGIDPLRDHLGGKSDDEELAEVTQKSPASTPIEGSTPKPSDARGPGQARAQPPPRPPGRFAGARRLGHLPSLRGGLADRTGRKARGQRPARRLGRSDRRRLGPASSDGSKVEGDIVLNATGARASSAHPWPGPPPPERATWSSPTATPASSPIKFWNWDISKVLTDLTPPRSPSTSSLRATGQLLIGSSRQYEVDDPISRARHDPSDDRSSPALHARARQTGRHPGLDRFSGRHARLPPHHRPSSLKTQNSTSPPATKG